METKERTKKLEKVKEQFLEFLNNPSLKEHWLTKGSVTKDMYEIFMNKFDYRKYGSIFYDEVWSYDSKMNVSPDNDESYPDGYCWRIRNHIGRDITFLSSIYNLWKVEFEVEKGYNDAIKNKNRDTDDLVFVDCELRIITNKLTNNSFMKFCDLKVLENEIEKYDDLSKRWKKLNKEKK